VVQKVIEAVSKEREKLWQFWKLCEK
jgi:hypothetical protein